MERLNGTDQPRLLFIELNVARRIESVPYRRWNRQAGRKAVLGDDRTKRTHDKSDNSRVAGGQLLDRAFERAGEVIEDLGSRPASKCFVIVCTNPLEKSSQFLDGAKLILHLRFAKI